MNFSKTTERIIHKNVMKRNFAGSPIMKDNIGAAVRKMKTGKATGPDSISVKLLEALEYRIDKITTLLKEIYGTGQTPTDIFKYQIHCQRNQGQQSVNCIELE